MQTKLTLRMDEDLIRFAKFYARRTDKSVSWMISDYFALLQAGEVGSEEELTPLVRSLKGALLKDCGHPVFAGGGRSPYWIYMCDDGDDGILFCCKR